MFKFRWLLALTFVIVLSAVFFCGCWKTPSTELDSTIPSASEEIVTDEKVFLPQEEIVTPEQNSAPEKVEVQQQITAEYELWLASAMVFGLSMDYPDFELLGIYSPSATLMKDKFDSQGVYILFRSSGTELTVEGKPLSAERTQPGTRDLSSAVLGFASFDEAALSAGDFSDMTELTMEMLGPTMEQSVLVSVYIH